MNMLRDIAEMVSMFMAIAEKSTQGERGKKHNITRDWITSVRKKGRISGAVLEAYGNLSDHGVYIQHSDS